MQASADTHDRPTPRRGSPQAQRPMPMEVTLVPADSGAIRTGRDGELLA